MSSSDDVGNGVWASGNDIDNNGANNSGIGSGSQNYGQGSGSNYVNPLCRNMNFGPGAGGVNSGHASGSINTFERSANFSSEHKTKSASIKTSNSHDEATESDEVTESDHDSKHADGNEEDNMFDGSQNLVETSKTRMPGKDKMDIEELIPCSKAEKAMIEDPIVNPCAAMRHTDLTLLADMDENFFYLFWDAIDKIERINIEVGKVRVHFLNLTKVYLGKSKFGIAGGDMTSKLDEQIEEQAKCVENMKKSFTETQELIHKLEASISQVTRPRKDEPKF